MLFDQGVHLEEAETWRDKSLEDEWITRKALVLFKYIVEGVSEIDISFVRLKIVFCS